MKVTQFVMAYGVEQDRLRAMTPEGFNALRPVLRINAETRDAAGSETAYLEFNMPVEGYEKRGWLNIDHWSSEDGLSVRRKGEAVTFTLPFLEITFKGTGAAGGCPAERDNDGCFFLDDDMKFHPAEQINENKEFCDCRFAWSISGSDASGESTRETLPAFNEEQKEQYKKRELTAENAAAVPCRKVLGSYLVRFERAVTHSYKHTERQKLCDGKRSR